MTVAIVVVCWLVIGCVFAALLYLMIRPPKVDNDWSFDCIDGMMHLGVVVIWPVLLVFVSWHLARCLVVTWMDGSDK